MDSEEQYQSLQELRSQVRRARENQASLIKEKLHAVNAGKSVSQVCVGVAVGAVCGVFVVRSVVSPDETDCLGGPCQYVPVQLLMNTPEQAWLGLWVQDGMAVVWCEVNCKV